MLLTPAPAPPLPPRPCSAWLPLSEGVLSMAAEHLPSPLAAAPERFSRLLPPRLEQLKVGGCWACWAALWLCTEAIWLQRCSAAVSTSSTRSPAVCLLTRCVYLPCPPQVDGGQLGAELAAGLDASEGAVRRCEAGADAPLVLYVSKMVAVPAAALPR